MEKEEPAASSETKLERKSSIDTEPKTLFEKELDSARVCRIIYTNIIASLLLHFGLKFMLNTGSSSESD